MARSAIRVLGPAFAAGIEGKGSSATATALEEQTSRSREPSLPMRSPSALWAGKSALCAENPAHKERARLTLSLTRKQPTPSPPKRTALRTTRDTLRVQSAHMQQRKT